MTTFQWKWPCLIIHYFLTAFAWKFLLTMTECILNHFTMNLKWVLYHIPKCTQIALVSEYFPWYCSWKTFAQCLVDRPTQLICICILFVDMTCQHTKKKRHSRVICWPVMRLKWHIAYYFQSIAQTPMFFGRFTSLDC